MHDHGIPSADLWGQLMEALGVDGDGPGRIQHESPEAEAQDIAFTDRMAQNVAAHREMLDDFLQFCRQQQQVCGEIISSFGFTPDLGEYLTAINDAESFVKASIASVSRWERTKARIDARNAAGT